MFVTKLLCVLVYLKVISGVSVWRETILFQEKRTIHTARGGNLEVNGRADCESIFILNRHLATGQVSQS